MKLLDQDYIRDTSWMEQGLCTNEDPETWWIDPENGENALLREKKARVAKEICAVCPVRDQCLLYGLLTAKDDHWSVLGGTTHRERRAIRRQIGWN